jgi:ketosteroid isomerase-like protein
MIGVDVPNAEIFRTYLERFTQGNIDGAAELLADDFTFTGPILQSIGKADFLSGSAAAAAIARGCVSGRREVRCARSTTSRWRPPPVPA